MTFWEGGIEGGLGTMTWKETTPCGSLPLLQDQSSWALSEVSGAKPFAVHFGGQHFFLTKQDRPPAFRGVDAGHVGPLGQH